MVLPDETFEGTEKGARGGRGDAKHASSGCAIGVTTLTVGTGSVGRGSVGDGTDGGWSFCAGVGGGDAVGSGG